MHFETARAALDYTRVRAPFDGVVLARPAQVGELAGSEGPHFGLRRQEDGADEAGQEAGRFQGAGIQGLGEHHRGAVPGLRQQAAVEGGFDVKHGTPRALARRVYQGAAARFST